MSKRIFKVVTDLSWFAFQAERLFQGSEDDVRDGYIHLSTADQLTETLAKHFTGQAGLVLLAVDADMLGPQLKWEPSRRGQLFPHLYAPMKLDAVVWSEPLKLDGNGRHILPEAVTGVSEDR